MAVAVVAMAGAGDAAILTVQGGAAVEVRVAAGTAVAMAAVAEAALVMTDELTMA